MWMMSVPHRKHICGPLQIVTGIALLYYVDYCRTSLETHLWTSTISYGDSFFNMYMMSVPHRKHTCGPLQIVTGIALLYYVDYCRTTLETHLWISTNCYGNSFTLIYR
jgi:hypothetical protein